MAVVGASDESEDEVLLEQLIAITPRVMARVKTIVRGIERRRRFMSKSYETVFISWLFSGS